MAVGHSGCHGMACKDKQENCIKEFAKRDTQLIVTTSVLEEGIDVGQCDTIVAFTGLKSLIGFIQIRGRTRKSDFTFVLLETESEMALYKNAENQEETMRMLLKQRS